MKIKRLVNCYIPVSACNFACRYCLVPQFEGRKNNAMPQFDKSPKDIGRALSKDRLGGPCFMNICGDGETLLPKEVPEIIKELLLQGHFLEVVTNGVLTNRFEEIYEICDKGLLNHLEFKFSYHYEQLLNRNLLDTYWKNVRRAREMGCSITVELVPHDELIPYIEEIKKDCIKNVGALCHVTIAYNYADNLNLLTKLSREEYVDIWSQFDSEMFRFKMSVLGQKRREFCYAGQFLMSINLGNGKAHQCYGGLSQDLYNDLEKPIRWNAIGHFCPETICFNAHALLLFGAIPKLAKDITYSDIRNRVCEDGSEWLTPEVKQFFSSKLIDSNKEYNIVQKIKSDTISFARIVWKNIKLGR